MNELRNILGVSLADELDMNISELRKDGRFKMAANLEFWRNKLIETVTTWNKAEGNPPPPIGDCRKLVWLVDTDSMGWIGIRAYHHGEGYWMVGNQREESATVTHWMDLPERP